MTALHDASPNPATTQLQVRYALATAGDVRITLHDLLGRDVARLVSGEQGAGEHRARLDTSGLAAGVYVLRMTAPGGFAEARRVTVVR